MSEEQEIQIPTTKEFWAIKDRLDAVGEKLGLSDLSAGAIKARIYDPSWTPKGTTKSPS